MFKIKNPICYGQDPFILPYNGKYYHYTQSKDDAGFNVFVSDDLQVWTDLGRCLSPKDCIGCSDFWAPEVIEYNNKFIMVYSADMHLAIALADSPIGPYKQRKKQWLFEKNAIDGHILIDDNKLYLFNVFWGVTDRNASREEIWGAELGEDLVVKEKTLTRLIIPEKKWELEEGNVVEGPYVLKHKEKYYMTYSANNFTCQSYAVGYAVADTPLGKYIKYENNPILKSGKKYFAPGHNSFFKSIADDSLYCIYHIHKDKNKAIPRKICLSLAAFKAKQGDNDVLYIEAPIL